MTNQSNATQSESTPYVVSCDLVSILGDWTICHGFTLPSADFFEGLRFDMFTELSKIFKNVEMLSECTLRTKLALHLEQVSLPIVNMDQVYTNIGLPLQVSRAVDATGRDSGIINRTGTQSIESQIRSISAACTGNVVLVDDVIFSGALIIDHVIPRLSEYGLNVVKVYATVGIGSGIERLVNSGIDTHCLYVYPQVLDEICERDFYPGVSFAGRTVLGSEGFGMPYVRPFGDIVSWASVPEEFAESFSQFCIKQAINLFREIEHCSGRLVTGTDVSRPVFGLEYTSPEESHANALARHLRFTS